MSNKDEKHSVKYWYSYISSTTFLQEQHERISSSKELELLYL